METWRNNLPVSQHPRNFKHRPAIAWVQRENFLKVRLRSPGLSHEHYSFCRPSARDSWGWSVKWPGIWMVLRECHWTNPFCSAVIWAAIRGLPIYVWRLIAAQYLQQYFLWVPWPDQEIWEKYKLDQRHVGQANGAIQFHKDFRSKRGGWSRCRQHDNVRPSIAECDIFRTPW